MLNSEAKFIHTRLLATVNGKKLIRKEILSFSFLLARFVPNLKLLETKKFGGQQHEASERGEKSKSKQKTR